jgi:hypothetical protein
LKIWKAINALTIKSNGGGLRITKKCKIQGYKYPVWYSKKAITNIICLKNLIKCYRVMLDSGSQSLTIHGVRGIRRRVRA